MKHYLYTLVCRLIPAQCPFEHDIKFWSKTLHIPPLCRFNPLYETLMRLRMRALLYLSEICGEDVSRYCR